MLPNKVGAENAERQDCFVGLEMAVVCRNTGQDIAGGFQCQNVCVPAEFTPQIGAFRG